MRWFRVIYIFQVGRRHGKSNYPREGDAIQIPVYGTATGDDPVLTAETAREPIAAVPANDLAEALQEIEA